MAQEIEKLIAKLANAVVLNDDEVIDLRTFDRLQGTSPATRKRLFAAGKGPPVVQLSERRRGIVMRDYKKWRESLTK